MTSYRSVICGRDGSEDSRGALREALRIAAAEGGRLTVVQAVPMPWIEQSQEDYQLPVDAILASYRQQIRDELGALGADDETAGNTRVEVRIGSPREVLERTAEEVGADLAVLGTRGDRSASRGSDHGLGSNASACLQASGRAVLLVNRHRPGPFRRIAACTDLGPTGEAVVASAARIALDERAALDVIHAIRPPWMQDELFSRGWRQGDSPDFRREFIGLWTSRLQASVRHATDDIAIEPESHLLPSPDPGAAVVQWTRERESDLVVLGRQSHGALARFFLGSTAARILRSVDASVLVVATATGARS